MPSIFNTFGLEGESFKLMVEDKHDFDCQSTTTEKNSLARSRESIQLSETEEEEIILSNNQQKSADGVMDTSSGYITNSIITDNLCKQTSSYIEDSQQNLQTRLVHSSTTTIYDSFPCTAEVNIYVEDESINCTTTGDDWSTAATGNKDEQCENVWNIKSGYVLEPADYILPTIKPPVYFSFPKELLYATDQ